MRLAPEAICRVAIVPEVALGPSCSTTLALFAPSTRVQRTTTEVAVSVAAADESS